MKLTIRGLQQAQQANLRAIAATKPGGALGRAVLYATTGAQRAAVVITHVDTGALRASHRIRMERGGLRGVIYIDPTGKNPRTGQRTAIYGPSEHARGGSHAFYERTVNEAGPDLVRGAGTILARGVR